jgi:DNA-binding IclR family transcriptional regulator
VNSVSGDDKSSFDAAKVGESTLPEGVQSIEVGMGLLSAFATSSEPQMISRLAQAAGMPPSKARRYLVSLIRARMVEQDLISGRYRLGPLALRLGLVALQGLDVVQVGTDALFALREQVEEALYFSIWGGGGPTIVRTVEPRRAFTLLSKPGTVLPLLTTATGRVFSAYLAKTTVDPLVHEQVLQNRKDGFPESVSDLKAVNAALNDVRARGYAYVKGETLFGIEALAAPMFDHNGQIVGVLSTNTVSRSLTPDSGGAAILSKLLNASRSASARLGCSGR